MKTLASVIAAAFCLGASPLAVPPAAAEYLFYRNSSVLDDGVRRASQPPDRDDLARERAREWEHRHSNASGRSGAGLPSHGLRRTHAVPRPARGHLPITKADTSGASAAALGPVIALRRRTDYQFSPNWLSGAEDVLSLQLILGLATSRARAAVKALPAAAILHDDTGAEKPHTGNHIGDDLGSPGVAVEVHTNVSERGGADSNQCVRSQPAASPRYCRSAPIRVPRTNAAKTLMSVSTKSLTLNVCRNAMSDGPFDAL
jgi:hypothetical protein